MARWAHAFASYACSTDTITPTHAAIVRIIRNVCACIAARYLPCGTRTLAIVARRAERTEEPASAAILFVRTELHAADVWSAIHRPRSACARAGNARTIRSALVAAHSAVIGISRQVSAGILLIASNLTGRTRRTSPGHAHLAIAAMIASRTTILHVFGQIDTTTRTRHETRVTRTRAIETRRAGKTIIAASATILFIRGELDARISALLRPLRTRANTGNALATNGAIISARPAIVDVSRKIRAHALRITRDGTHGTIAKSIDTRSARGTFIAACSAIFRIRRQMGANAAAIIRRRRSTCRTLTTRALCARRTSIATLTAIRRIGR